MSRDGVDSPSCEQKAPLTAKSTVQDCSKQGSGGSMGPPPPVPVSQVQRAADQRQRQKVPHEHGMSQLEFIRSTKDMSGLNGKPRRKAIPRAEVAEHNTPRDAWVVLHGKVYNLTPYLPFHPGGAAILEGVAGTDCTELFNRYHRWVNADFLLKNCLVGHVE
uniref:Cytochrome b5 reductase 4-like n=1 Tax=Tetraselmis sp. GSL018 TaxID=582737 RepID=A0A061SC27_9CHLO|mmetsp:Transcript_10054/g.23980  ORF Transcript_10054/g.23980 Transcript_10054/m.23980 type:complete len:162 (-) Transcript_10054:208-693(-)